LLPASRNESSRDLLPGAKNAIDLHHKELTFSQFKKGLTTL